MPGFLPSSARPPWRNTPNETTFGPIFRKEIFGTIDTVNLFMEKDIGNYASPRPAFLYAWETRLDLGTPIEPGFQAYGQPSSFSGYNSALPQDNRIGPQLFGTIAQFGPGSLKWNGGILFGVTPGRAARNPALAGRVRNPFLIAYHPYGLGALRCAGKWAAAYPYPGAAPCTLTSSP